MENQDINSPETGFTDIFLTHAYTPRNVGVMTNPDGFGAPKGLCGDTIEIGLEIRDDCIQRALFMTDGCAHTIACGSVITEMACGRTLQEAMSIEADEIGRGTGRFASRSCSLRPPGGHHAPFGCPGLLEKTERPLEGPVRNQKRLAEIVFFPGPRSVSVHERPVWGRYYSRRVLKLLIARATRNLGPVRKKPVRPEGSPARSHS